MDFTVAFALQKTLGKDIEFTWIGDRKSWIEAVKRALTILNPTERIDEPPERIVIFGLETRGFILASGSQKSWFYIRDLFQFISVSFFSIIFSDF